LLDACAERLWLVAERGVAPFDGDLDDYRRLVLSDRGGSGGGARADKSADARPGRAELRRAAAGKRAETASLRKEMARAEAEVGRLTREIETIDAALADGGLFASDPAKAAELAKARSDLAAALVRAEDDWLAAGTALQTAMG
jgi:ATP-binding cassette subfamily F protein 3